jgi:FkbM family methyltransferase
MTDRHSYTDPLTWTALRLLRRTGLLKRVSFTVKARMEGIVVRIPLRKGLGFQALAVSEPWGHSIFSALMKAFPGTVVDVGVNLGQTLIRVRGIDPDRMYIGFEPNPTCVFYSRMLASMNKFNDCPIVPVGLSTEDGIVDLVMNNDDLTDPAASIVQNFRPGKPIVHRIPVAVMRFTTAARDMRIGQLGLVKIDVEGSEREVLLAMEERLGHDRPAVVMEILPAGQESNTDRLTRQQDVQALFSRLNYRMLRIHNKGDRSKLEHITGPIGIHKDQDLANFVVLPAERAEELFPTLEKALLQQ